MATPTYELIETTTLSSSASSVTFSSITQDYRDLVLVFQANPTGTFLVPQIRFNSDSGSNYSKVYMFGDGSTTTSSSDTDDALKVTNISTLPSTHIYNFMDYSATDKHKSALYRGGTIDDGSLGSSRIWALAGRWANTSAITTIDIFGGYTGNLYGVGSTFSIYGIAS